MESTDISNTYTSGYDTSSATGSSHPSSKKTKKLTIEYPTKIEKEQGRTRFYKHRPSKGVVYLKWIATFILALLLLAFVTQSKISVISISENMHRHATASDGPGTQEACRMFVMLFLIILIPNCVNFLRGVWGGLFRKDIPWPRKSALFLGVLVSAIETFGICVFVMKLPAMTKPYNVILLMNCVFLIPVGVALFRAVRVTESRSTKKVTFCVIAFILELAGIGLICYIWYQNSSMELKDVWYPVVSVICLSIAWLPEIQSFLLRTKPRDAGYNDVNSGTPNYSYTCTGSDETTLKTVSEERDREFSDSVSVNLRKSEVSEQPQLIAEEKPTWKMVIFMSFWKIVFTFVFSFVLLRIAVFSADSGDVSSHFKMGWYGWQERGIYYFIANCCSSLLGYVVGYIACTTCMQKGSFVLPLFLATPLAAVLLAVYNSCVGLLFPGVPGSTCDLHETMDVILFSVATACLVFAHVFSFGYPIFTSKALVKQNEAQLFWLPTYNAVLLEQWLLLTKRNKHNEEVQEDLVAKAKRSRVIICTTMYREVSRK